MRKPHVNESVTVFLPGHNGNSITQIIDAVVVATSSGDENAFVKIIFLAKQPPKKWKIGKVSPAYSTAWVNASQILGFVDDHKTAISELERIYRT